MCMYLHSAWKGRPRNALYCVGWDVKSYSLTYFIFLVVGESNQLAFQRPCSCLLPRPWWRPCVFRCLAMGPRLRNAVLASGSAVCWCCLAVVCISEDPGKEPEHMASIKLDIIESRLDYMGSSILMGRVSDLAVKMNDEWHVDTGAPKPNERRSSVATSRFVRQLIHPSCLYCIYGRMHSLIFIADFCLCYILALGWTG